MCFKCSVKAPQRTLSAGLRRWSQSEAHKLWQCHTTAPVTAPEIQSVMMQLLLIKYTGEINLASGSILSPTNHRALFPEQTPFLLFSHAVLLHISKRVNAPRSFSTYYRRWLFLNWEEDVLRTKTGIISTASTDWSITCYWWQGWWKQVDLPVMSFLWYKGILTAAYKSQSIKSSPLHLNPLCANSILKATDSPLILNALWLLLILTE